MKTVIIVDWYKGAKEDDKHTRGNLTVVFLFRIDGCGMIKVADFGLSKSLYERLYFRQERRANVKLPIKWLAVECIEDGIFSEKSDVVSVS